MNRVLKVVFSRAKGMFVVVSELGRACTKGTLKSVLVAVPIALVSLGMSNALAADLQDTYIKVVRVDISTDAAKATDLGTIAIGDGASATNAGSVAIGDGATANGFKDSMSQQQPSISLGKNATSSGAYAIAIGSGDGNMSSTTADGDFAIAIGIASQATSTAALALGHQAQASASSATAVGYKAKAMGQRSMALGFEALVNESGKTAKSVALGSYSVVHEGDVLDGEESGVLSVGNSTQVGYFNTPFNRRIINVADGVNDNDVVTVGQTKAALADILGSGFTVDLNAQGDWIVNSDDGSGGTVQTTISEAIAEAAASGRVDWSRLTTEAQIAIRGVLDDEFQIRPAATTFSSRAVSLNYVSNNLTVGENLYALDQQVYANATAIAGLNNSVIDWTQINQAIDDKIAQSQLTNGDHTTVESTDSNVSITPDNSGNGLHYEVTLNKKQKLESVELKSTDGKTTNVNGSGLFVGGSDKTNATAYVADGVVSAGQGDKQIVMNGKDGTLKVGNNLKLDSSGKITGVAAGTVSADSTDAVNGSQLYETQQMIGQNASNIQTLNQQINKTYDKVQRVGAGAAALAALRPQDFSPEHPISGAVGLGHYDGKQAIAVGMYYRPTENFTVGFGASAAGNDDYMMNAGISYRFGGSGSQLRLSQSDINRKVVDLTDQNRALVAQIESSNIREEASAKRLQAAEKKAVLADQKLDMVMKELAALREEIQKMKQR